MKRLLVILAICIVAAPAVYAAERADGESSPYAVGQWFLSDTFQDGTTPVNIVDSQFTFLNPTKDTLILEYAFFDNEGGFCGCDRDTLNPNGVTRYTMSAEASGGMFACTGASLPLQTSGTLKSIVFTIKGKRIILGDAAQVGYQLHFFQGGNITEAPLRGIAINRNTIEEITQIHNKCVDFCNTSGLCPPLP